MNPDLTKKIGRVVRIYMIVRDVAGGIIVSVVLAAAGIAILLLDHSGKNLGSAIFFLVLSPLGFLLVGWQLYLRLKRRKDQSTNLAYQATDGDVAINRPSALQTNVSSSDLAGQTIKAWMGPVFSNQNLHIRFGVDSTPNTENTLLVTEKFFIGLLIGPAENSTGLATQFLNIAPISNSEKNAFGTVIDGTAIRQNMEQQLTTKQITELVQTYGGFIIPLAEIETAQIDINANTLKINFKNGKNRSWVYSVRGDQLAHIYQQIQESL